MDGLYQAILTVVSGGAMINPDIATKVFRLFRRWQILIMQSMLMMIMLGN